MNLNYALSTLVFVFLHCWFITSTKNTRHAGSLFGAKIGWNCCQYPILAEPVYQFARCFIITFHGTTQVFPSAIFKSELNQSREYLNLTPRKWFVYIYINTPCSARLRTMALSWIQPCKHVLAHDISHAEHSSLVRL